MHNDYIDVTNVIDVASFGYDSSRLVNIYIICRTAYCPELKKTCISVFKFIKYNELCSRWSRIHCVKVDFYGVVCTKILIGIANAILVQFNIT